MDIKKIIVGSRESRLAVVQSEQVVSYLRNTFPEIQTSLLTMKTTGDKILDKRLDQVGGKGLFVKELDKALLSKKTDLSVHSLKDLPMEIPEELPVICYSHREDPRDVLVLPKASDGKAPVPEEIGISKPVGTSSRRRVLQLKMLHPDWKIESVRGNVQTRLRKLDEGKYSALILAAAGLKRLGLEDRISRYFSADEIIPSAGQGILAVQGRKDFPAELFSRGFADESSAAEATAERAFVAFLNGGCTSPIAAHAVCSGNELTIRGFYYEENSRTAWIGSLTGSISEAKQTAEELANRLKAGKGEKTDLSAVTEWV